MIRHLGLIWLWDICPHCHLSMLASPEKLILFGPWLLIKIRTCWVFFVSNNKASSFVSVLCSCYSCSALRSSMEHSMNCRASYLDPPCSHIALAAPWSSVWERGYTFSLLEFSLTNNLLSVSLGSRAQDHPFPEAHPHLCSHCHEHRARQLWPEWG